MKLLKRIGVIIGSYLLACVTSTLLALICLSFFINSNDLDLTSISNFFVMLFAVSLFTGVCAAVPAGLFILYSELSGRPGWRVHALAGALTGFIITVSVSMAIGGLADKAAWLTLMVAVVGAVGAVVYWKLAVSWVKEVPLDQLRPVEIFD